MTRFPWRAGSMVGIAALTLTLTSALTLNAQNGTKPPPPVPQIGHTFQIPYRLTDTNHFLVRVRINGKGPFNFLVDSGAPALFIATETAKKVGLKPIKDEFWTPVDRLDFEGGAELTRLKARVEDPFQLVGMNALGLPGASIDGILGFHDPGAVPARDRPFQGPDGLDKAGLLAARSPGTQAQAR